MNMLKKLLKKEEGNVAVIVAVSMAALIGIAAMAVDAGQLYFEKSKLQKTVDAAALAGAQVYYTEHGAPVTEAREIAEANGFSIAEGDVSVEDTSVTVSHSSEVSLTFARALGFHQADVHATATAGIFPLSKSIYAAPLAVEESNIPEEKYLNCDNPGGGGNCGFLAVEGRGASSLEEAFIDGIEFNLSEMVNKDPESEEESEKGVETEPGKMMGKVSSSVEELIQRDLGKDQCNDPITADNSCSRVIIVVVVPDGSFAKNSGRSRLEVLGFASYWLEGMGDENGNGNKNHRIVGQFIDMVTLGEGEEGIPEHGAYNVRLID
jgi:hypothetical protein